MNRDAVDRIVAATLYEGYILYPYRPSSVKNQVRWTFGGVYPRAYSEAVAGAEPWSATTECLLRGGDDAAVTVTVRFLHVVNRAPAEVPVPATDPPAAGELRRVDALLHDGRMHRSWEEATERSLDAGTVTVSALLQAPVVRALAVEAGSDVEWLRDGGGLVTAALLRDHGPLAVEARVVATRVSADITRVAVTITNVTPVTAGDIADRDAALRHALVSTHVVLGVSGGSWLSLADPPADAGAAAAECVNIGLWPILVGDPGSTDTILASPIILEDHPQVAAESAGELFDSTEIDEILSLRILTLTDEEKAEMRGADERARAILERTEALTGDDFMRMHGTLRSNPPRIGSSG